MVGRVATGRRRERRVGTLIAAMVGWYLGLFFGAAVNARADMPEELIPRRVLDPLNQCPTWTGRAESLLLWRDAPQAAPLFTSLDSGPAITAGDLVSGMAAGPRFSLFRHTGDLGALEFTYFNVQSFSASQSATTTVPDAYVFSDGVLCCAPFAPFDQVDASLSNEFQSFEFNRRFPTDGRIQWLMGFRWVQWNDVFSMNGSNAVFPQVLGIDNRTNNDLYGLQVGFDSVLLRTGTRFWVEGLGKAGIYGNRAAQFTSFTDSAEQLPNVSGGTWTSRAAFVGELGVTGVWQVTDWLAVRTGWVAFWLDGLALSPNQLAEQCLVCQDEPIRQATNTGGGVFVNGLTLGLEARW